MDFDTYQVRAALTAIYPESYQIVYPALGLFDEVGELVGAMSLAAMEVHTARIAGLVKKGIRDDGFTAERREAIAKEIGDVQWYLNKLAGDLGLRMDDIVQANLTKLQDRQARGVLQGSGDER